MTDWFDHTSNWNKLTSVIEIQRTRYNKTTKQETSETAYYLSSLPINPKLANKAVRQHWGIENSLHHVLDVTFREDNSRIRVKNATENMAVLRRLALNLIKLSDKKGSVKSIIKQCAWNDEVRDLILKG